VAFRFRAARVSKRYAGHHTRWQVSDASQQALEPWDTCVGIAPLDRFLCRGQKLAVVILGQLNVGLENSLGSALSIERRLKLFHHCLHIRSVDHALTEQTG
jgi:hypothetical protein